MYSVSPLPLYGDCPKCMPPRAATHQMTYYGRTIFVGCKIHCEEEHSHAVISNKGNYSIQPSDTTQVWFNGNQIQGVMTIDYGDGNVVHTPTTAYPDPEAAKRAASQAAHPANQSPKLRIVKGDGGP